MAEVEQSLMHKETIDLPSRGWFYPPTHPLSSGKIDLYSPTAYHEDILTSANLIQRGTVVDKFLEAVIATKGVKYSEILSGDKNAIFVAARILAYGRNYEVTMECPACEAKNSVTIDLQELKDKEVPFPAELKGKNEFVFVTPLTKKTVLFRLLTQSDEKAIQAELDGLKRVLKSDITPEVTTRMRRAIISVDGSTDPHDIRKFVESLPTRDARAFREYGRKIMPDIDLRFTFSCQNCEHTSEETVPIGITFLWPDTGL